MPEKPPSVKPRSSKSTHPPWFKKSCHRYKSVPRVTVACTVTLAVYGGDPELLMVAFVGCDVIVIIAGGSVDRRLLANSIA